MQAPAIIKMPRLRLSGGAVYRLGVASRSVAAIVGG